MIKRAYLVHGWGGSSEDPWFVWLKKELKKKKFKVYIYDMPDTENPKIENWLDHLRNNINLDEVDEHTYFVGHSIGCQTIMRFLEKLHRHKRVAGCAFVAPWLDLINLSPEEMRIAHPWINTKIDFERILDHTSNFLCLFSSNDPYVHVYEAEKFKDKLGAKVIIKENKGHFDEESGVKRITEILGFLK